MSGREQLRAWLVRSAMQDKELAQLLGISRAYLSQLLSGVRRPGLDIAESINTLTGVPMASWADKSLSTLGRPTRRIPPVSRGSVRKQRVS